MKTMQIILFKKQQELTSKPINATLCNFLRGKNMGMANLILYSKFILPNPELSCPSCWLAPEWTAQMIQAKFKGTIDHVQHSKCAKLQRKDFLLTLFSWLCLKWSCPHGWHERIRGIYYHVDMASFKVSSQTLKTRLALVGNVPLS